MAEVIGVRFKEVGKVYYFDPDGQLLKKGDRVIVETARGVECGEVAMDNREVSDEEIVKPLKSLSALRLTTISTLLPKTSARSRKLLKSVRKDCRTQS